MSSSLYICYFGLLEPLVQTQVLPYLRELGKDGHQISLVTFEGNVVELEHYGVSRLKDELAAQGIDWHWLKYHKRFSVIATGYDVIRGAMFVRKRISREPVDILHGRVHIPVLMAAIGRKFSTNKPKLLFDIRGFFPEEYVDAGIWKPNGLLYRTVKKVEGWLMKEADGFVVLTEEARSILFPESKETGRDQHGRPVEVIPCCVDFDVRFAAESSTEKAALRRDLGIEGRYVIVHSGALGGLYLTHEIVELLSLARTRNPDTFALFLTQSDSSEVLRLLEEKGFTDNDYLVTKVGADEIARYLSTANIALSFVKLGRSSPSRSPTKIPEYLACGLPVISNSGIGDGDELFSSNRVGILIEDVSEESYITALSAAEVLTQDPELRARCQKVAKSGFDLHEVGGKRYCRLYQKLTSGEP
jgi:glycosyltransferase involved in cell wall biosynthesis